MYTYSQTKGVLIDADGKHVATGYSGNGMGYTYFQYIVSHGPTTTELRTTLLRKHIPTIY